MCVATYIRDAPRTASSARPQSPVPGLVVTIKPSSPVCPECHSSLNRIPRRLVDRLLSVFYPVHRYHCRSFVCNWEGNLRCTAELGRWKALASYSDERRRRESDTLPGPATRLPNFRKPDARADSRNATSAPRRAERRANAVLR